MDKRSRKTQKAIAGAFKELVEEKGGISKVSVRDIANRANISRSTFYSHYDDIDDLTEAMKENIAIEIGEIIQKHASQKDKSVPVKASLQLLFTDILKFLVNQDFLTKEIILNSKNNGITDSLSDNIFLYLKEQILQRGEPVEDTKVHDASLFLVYGCAGMIKDWFLNRSSADPEATAKKMADVVDSIVSYYEAQKN